ncbi:hypothetical protein FRUB_09252 [Fimbriiglobus ruber]|uniref:Uncharacterized protein n=1 Tax=Fimbriiglobus ruber TaxID=1908690 RepID=A0A225DHM3_9BACT|nr:hypothetical protein FRUB_09252 [Fimbriiglobus ruber]
MVPSSGLPGRSTCFVGVDAGRRPDPATRSPRADTPKISHVVATGHWSPCLSMTA